jgi:hypothetical protein
LYTGLFAGFELVVALVVDVLPSTDLAVDDSCLLLIAPSLVVAADLSAVLALVTADWLETLLSAVVRVLLSTVSLVEVADRDALLALFFAEESRAVDRDIVL